MADSLHPLERFFQQAVRNSYQGSLGLHDPQVLSYVARLLCEFSDSENLYKMRDETGHPMEELEEMISASDPVNGSAPLFVAGMYPEALKSNRRLRHHCPTLEELVKAGKESYFIVSQFNLFEYEQEAPLFARLSDRFEHCMVGLTLVREDLHGHGVLRLPPPESIH